MLTSPAIAAMQFHVMCTAAAAAAVAVVGSHCHPKVEEGCSLHRDDVEKGSMRIGEGSNESVRVQCEVE